MTISCQVASMHQSLLKYVGLHSNRTQSDMDTKAANEETPACFNSRSVWWTQNLTTKLLQGSAGGLPSGYVNSLLLKMAIYSEFSH